MQSIPLLLKDVALAIVWPFLIFALLALITKRRGIVSAVHGMRGEFSTNLLLFAGNALLIGLLFLPASNAVSDVLDQSRLLAPFWTAVPEVVTLIAAVVVIDFVAYWRHRAEHSASLWRIHATHHADTRMHWLSVQRKHPLARVLSLMVDSSLALVLGFPAWSVVAAMLLRTWWGYFTHADLPWTLGPLGRVLISPAAHRLHHIRDEALMGTNYGNTVALWDRMFGTWCDPEPYIGCETGIEEGTRGFFGELMRPFERRYWRSAAPRETGVDAPTA